MSEKTKTVKDVFKAVLPVIIGIVLIVLIALVVTNVKSCNSKRPTLTNGNETYISVGDLEVTNDRLYVYLKQSYGVSELLRLVDNILYADDVKEALKDENKDALQAYINKSLYGVEDLKDWAGTEEELNEVKADVIESLRLTGLLTEEEAKNEDTVNGVIKTYYALQYAREEWAKEEYLKRYLEDRKENGYDTFFDADEIEDYYEKNYVGTSVAFYIPFTTKEAALKMMARYGINTQTNVLSKNGWVTDAYDYNKDTTVNDSQFFTNKQVVDKFVAMYNEFYKNYNGGQNVINEGDVAATVNNLKTTHAVKNALSTAMTAITSSVTQSAVLPLSAEVLKEDNTTKAQAAIEWTLEDNEYLKLEGNTLVLKSIVASTKSIKITAKVTYEGEVSENTYTLKLTTPSSSTLKPTKVNAATASEALTAAATSLTNTLNNVKAKGSLLLPTVIENEVENTNVTITWKNENTDNATFVNNKATLLVPHETDAEVTLKAELDCNGTKQEFEYKLTIPAAKTNISVAITDTYVDYKFTEAFLEAQKDGDFKFEWTLEDLNNVHTTLASNLKATGGKLTTSVEPELFYKSYTVSPLSVGSYYVLAIVLDTTEAPALEDVEAEIIEKLKEELLTENNITNMIYTRRSEANFQIFDSYLEALYDYEYTKFYETTLGLKEADYTVFKNSKKRTVTNAASIEVNGETITISADKLFTELEEKYGPSTALSLVKLYEVVGSDFNKLYNPYTGATENEAYFEDILENEVYGLRKNFELDYFTYSYLEYYGFIPNFPSKYGWLNFIKDYFGSFTEEELAASASFGGTIYNEAYKAYVESLYNEANVEAEMKALADKWYSISAHNLIISVDRNFDGNPDTDFDWQAEFKDGNGKTYEDLAKDLAKDLLTYLDQTCDTTYNAGMTTLINMYNKADINAEAANANSTIYDHNYWAKYKQAGLILKLESNQSYSWASNSENTFDSETGKLVDEFSAEAAKLYKQIKEKELGTNLEVVLTSEEAFATTYGYHVIAVTKGIANEEKPTEDEIRLFKAFQEVEEWTDSTTKYGKDKLAKAEEALKALLKELELEEDYKLDTATSAKLKAWYEQAIWFIEQGESFSGVQALADLINDNVLKAFNDGEINFKNTDDANRFKFAVEISIEDSESDSADNQ